ncbi:hypothetical protein FOA52_009696 [Chlamydomonas sp. UWO 241]|nr:hypothetical protein FOA52_009696 [Chlamydomonas sp. UWO 241]
MLWLCQSEGHLQRLAADCDDDSAAVISAAPLSKLRALSLEHKGAGGKWSVPALSLTASAGLEELCFNAHIFPRSSTLLSLKEAVRGCSQLCTLSLKGCRVLDLSALADCVHLEKLSAFGFIGCFSSFISDLAPLGGCAKLKDLSVVYSLVSDLAPLGSCVELQDLSIGGCPRLESLEGLQACRELERLGMNSLPVSSLEPLSACAQLKDLNIYQCVYLNSLAYI